MTRKEQEPKGNREEREEREKAPKDIDYNPDITEEDKEVLNNQAKDENRGDKENDYFKDREEPIDYAGADLDIPQPDDKQFNQTKNEADDVEKQRRPKESANSNDDIEANTETVYKGEEAERYQNDKKNSDEDRHLRNKE